MQFDNLLLGRFIDNYSKVGKKIAPWCIGWLQYPSFYKFLVQEGTSSNVLNEQVHILGRVFDA